jgi:pimeloyl-ACP methyl ester carboxylesterase
LPRLARFRCLLALLAITMLARPALAAEGAVALNSHPAPSSIVIGFVGGFVRHDNPHHGPVVLARRIQKSVSKDVYVQVFENRRRRDAYKLILGLLDRDRDGVLEAQEKAQARIILFGQSWGASAVVMLARELDRAGIPVLLTVQVDSVAKLWQNDSVIPANVVAAANFYQPSGLIHGRAHIIAADPSKTQILGNYRFDYRKNPVQCNEFTWADRFFTPGHMQSECDPHLWGEVEDLVNQRIESQHAMAAAAPEPGAR